MSVQRELQATGRTAGGAGKTSPLMEHTVHGPLLRKNYLEKHGGFQYQHRRKKKILPKRFSLGNENSHAVSERRISFWLRQDSIPLKFPAMKIISGILRNRNFRVPKRDVRPTKGQVREAVFSSLGGTCEGLRVLDLFAGSGGLGLEAWSRGAATVTFVEQHFGVWKNLRKNVEILSSSAKNPAGSREYGQLLGKAVCIRANVFTYLARTAGETFDLIFADPPYDLPGAMEKTLNGIREHSILSADGVLVYELRSSEGFALTEGWELFKNKAYGKTRILMLRLNEGRYNE